MEACVVVTPVVAATDDEIERSVVVVDTVVVVSMAVADEEIEVAVVVVDTEVAVSVVVVEVPSVAAARIGRAMKMALANMMSLSLRYELVIWLVGRRLVEVIGL
jgi:hypothetical protein